MKLKRQKLKLRLWRERMAVLRMRKSPVPPSSVARVRLLKRRAETRRLVEEAGYKYVPGQHRMED